jgi:hypothetical protein
MQKKFLLLAGLICTILSSSAYSQEESSKTFCYYAGKQYSEAAWLCVAKLRAIVCLRNGAWQTILPNDSKSKNVQIDPEVCPGPSAIP